jgi:uncharacterized membrane protein YcaP (DUF421 family)
MDVDVLARIFGEGAKETIAWWQMALRAAVMFLWGLLLVRLGGQRMFGKLVNFDIVLTVVLGSILGRAVTGGAPLLPSMAATGLLVTLHWGMTQLSCRWPGLGRVIKGGPLCLVRDGEVQSQAMRRHGITREDLEEACREDGISGLDQLHEAYLERSGEISVLPRR